MSLQRLLFARQLISEVRCCRLIHQSAIVHKKKKALNLDVDDLFATDDLFGSTSKQQPSQSSTKPTAKVETTAKPQTRHHLSAEDRLARFNTLLAFVSDRIGLKPVAKTPEQVRKTAWQQLFSLATTREQLDSVTELFSRWRDSRKVFDDRTVAAFVRRCEELHCSDLALSVFSNHSKYGFPITSLSVARHLLHSLHTEHPISSTITLAALFGVYKLPPPSEDLVSAAMLTSACFTQNTPNSNIVASALVPSLRNMLKVTPPIPLPPKGAERAKEKEKAWLARTLYKIEKALKRQKVDYAWLREWREKSGHLSISFPRGQLT